MCCLLSITVPLFPQPKCDKYWPDSGTEMYGDIEVTLVKTEEFAYYVTHTLRIKKVLTLMLFFRQ